MHQCYAALTEKVLENVTKQIKNDINYIMNYDERDLYYCEICSKLVSIKCEQKHNRSRYHLKSVEKEKLANNFLSMYIQSNEANSSINSKKDVKENFSKYNVLSTESLINTGNSVIKNNNATFVIPINHIGQNAADDHDRGTQCDEYMSISSTSTESYDKNEMGRKFKTYLKEMTAKYNLNFNIPIAESNHIVIVTPKGYKEPIRFDNFHGYVRFGSIVSCHVCGTTIAEQEIEEHSATEKHVRNIVQPVNDNFLRKMTGLNMQVSYCLLCNMIAGTTYHTHIYTNYTKYNVIVDDAEISTKPKTTFCDVCSINMCTSNFTAHTKGKKHKTKLNAQKHMKNVINTQPNSCDSTSNLNLVLKKPKKTYCEVCQQNIDTHNLVSHTVGKKHKSMLDAIKNVSPKPQQEDLANMIQFDIPDKQYILSLDSFDLSFLSQYVDKKKEEKGMLWSKCADQEPLYYKVEISSDEVLEDDYTIEPCSKYMCYICNMDVPQKCYKQHNKSKLHQDCKKLAEKFLENVTKQMNIDLDNIPNYTEHDTFYCDTCCEVVPVKHKRKHKNSSHHLKYTQYEKIASEFLDIYINKYVDNHIKSENNNEFMLDPESIRGSDTDWSDENDDSEQTSISPRHNNLICPSVYTNQDIDRPRGESNIGTSLPFYEHNEFEALQQELKETIKINKLQCTLHTIEDNSIIIIIPKQNKEQMPLNTFSAQELNQKNVKQHTATVHDERNISQRVDNIVNRTEELLHHADVSVNHQQATTTKYNTSRNYASTSSGSENESFEDETISEEELYSATSDSHNTPFYNKANVDPVPNKLNEYYKQFCNLNATHIKCLICSVSVPHFPRNVIEHVEGFWHKDYSAILFRNNYIEKISLSEYFCHLCNININNFVHHINEDYKHKTELERGIFKRRLLREYIYDDPNIQHPFAIQCRRQYDIELKRNKIIPVGTSSFYCEICCINLSRISEIDHMFGERHKCALEG